MKKLFLAVLLLFPAIPIFSQLPNYVPAHGLAGWWSFSGNANDLSGHNAHGTVLGPALTADRHGNPNSAYQFDGMDDYILMGDPTPGHLQLQDSLTLSAWIFISSYPGFSTLGEIIGTQCDNCPYAGATIFIDGRNSPDGQPSPPGHIHFQIGSGTGWHTTNTQTQVPLNQWVLITATRKANENAKIYYNGVLQPSTSASWNGDVNYSGTYFAIGRQRDYGNRFFNGTIDDAGIWNRALQPCEIQQLLTEYNEQPSITCPGNLNRNTNPGLCTYTAQGTELDPGFTDDCPGTVILTNNINGSHTLAGHVFNPGTTNILWELHDANGLYAACSFDLHVNNTTASGGTLSGSSIICTLPGSGTFALHGHTGTILEWQSSTNGGGTWNSIAVTDSVYTASGVMQNMLYRVKVQTPACGILYSTVASLTRDPYYPSIDCPHNLTVNTNSGICGHLVMGHELDPSFSDNCPGAYITNSVNGLSSLQYQDFPLGTTTIIWYVYDQSGQMGACSFDLTVADHTAPELPSIPSAFAECSITLSPPTTFDDCAGTITGTTTDPVTYTTPGDYTVHWTFNDGNGNSCSQTQLVSVHDLTPPYVPPLPPVTGQCDVTVTPPIAIDNCTGDTIIGVTSEPLYYSQQGTYPIIWILTDPAGHTTFASQLAIVHDTTAPSVPVLAPVSGECSVTLTTPTASDNCYGTITGTTTNPTTYSTQGTYTVTWTFSDGNGNSSTATQTVTVDDVTPPVVPTLSPVSGECGATLTTPTTTDNCTVTVTGTTNDPTSYSAQGTYTVTWTFDDGNGNLSTATQTVTVDDVTPPVLPTLSPVSGECSVTLTTPTTTDNCTGTVTGTTNDPTSYSAQGIYTVTWTFDDGNGNSSTATQTVTVDDVTPPVVPTLSPVSGECSATLTTPTTTDNCTGTVTGTTNDPTSYSAQGIYTVTWTFSDGNGNSSTATQTVTVDDVTPPVLPTLSPVSGECSVTLTTPTTTDNCTGTVTGTTNDPTSYSAQGIYTVTWTFSDGNGNLSTATQTVTVDDVTPPAAPTLSPVSGECNATLTTPTTTDNCAGTITGTTNDPTSYSAQGTYTVTWTFDDGNGNLSTATQTATVEDTESPVPDLSSLPALTGCDSITISASPSATDNCTGAITGTTNDPLTYTVQGNYTVTWTFDDGNGQTSTQTQSVEIVDCSGLNAASEGSVLVYPNPGNGLFFLHIDDVSWESAEVRLISSRGQMIYASTAVASDSWLDFRHLSDGIYYLQVIRNNGKRFICPLVIKKDP